MADVSERDQLVAVIGLGYVGLPLAVGLAEVGRSVVGLDIDSRKVDRLNRGESHIPDVPGASVERLVKAGRLVATTDADALRAPDAIFICVPTPFDANRAPDLSYIRSAAQTIQPRLRSGHLIVLESTTYPGTTEEILQPMLETTGLRAGIDFDLAFVPERIDPGQIESQGWTIMNTPKVVGALTPRSGERAAAILATLGAPVHIVSSPRAAELAKLLENTFRSVNIALVNELALLCERMGIDVWEVIGAAATKPFGFMPFRPGPGVGGHCLAEDEFLFVKDGCGPACVRIGEYFDGLERQNPTVARRVAGTTLLEPTGVDVLSFDRQSQESCYKPLRALSRREYRGRMVSVTTIDRRCLRVTDGHPMLVWAKDSWQIKPACDLQPGDELIIATQQPNPSSSEREIDLIAHLPGDEIARTRVAPKDGRFQDHRDRLSPHLTALGVDRHEVFRSNRMPLWTFLELERRNAMPIPRRHIMLRTGRGPSANAIAAVIPIDEDFARLVGYYLSEGCITQDKSLRTRFVFNSGESEYIDDVCRIVTKLGLRYSKHKDRVWNAMQIRVSSNLFARLLRDVLNCGTRSTEMQIPGIVLDSSEPIRLAVLSGLLRGDGDVDLNQQTRHYYHKRNRRVYDHSINVATVGYFSSSPRLFQQTVQLAQGLGFVPTFKKDKPYLRFHGQQYLSRLTSLFDGAKRAALESYARNRKKKMPTKSHQSHGNFATVKIREVWQTDGIHKVYSAEVEDTHTFVTSYGIVTHNCIPVDPLYLSWKAREFDFHTNFINLAAQVNDDMPYHVVDLIVRGLSKQGRALDDAHVLVLGVAFKRDIDDARNSPAERLIELLIVRGATVAYHDPHVPQFAVGGNVFHRQREALQSTPLSDEALARADCVVVVTGHTAIDYRRVAGQARLVVDTCNAVPRDAPGTIVRLGAPAI
jgi:UDP-N-acetyl-D-mannosaminuronate dehydrogenase